MGTMLITRSTPRMTYRIGMRAWLEVLADKSLHSLVADAGGRSSGRRLQGYPSNFIGELRGNKEFEAHQALRRYLMESTTGPVLVRTDLGLHF